jgi:hypothetical protein
MLARAQAQALTAPRVRVSPPRLPQAPCETGVNHPTQYFEESLRVAEQQGGAQCAVAGHCSAACRA